MIRIAIVDDHELVRRGLKDLIESDQQLQVVAQAGNAFDGFQQIRNLKPEIAILDVRLLDGNGVELCREIQSCVPGVKVIMLTAFADDEALLGAILAGASGYLLKGIFEINTRCCSRSKYSRQECCGSSKRETSKIRFSRCRYF